jgi:hypothetical protein
VRLRPRHLAGVDGAVDQLEDSVPGEDLLVPAARPDGVRQHADLQAAGPQLAQRLGGVRGQLGVRVPLQVVLRQRVRRQLHLGEQADLFERAAAVLVAGPQPDGLLRGDQLRRQLVGPLLVDQARHRPPHVVQVDVVPGRQGAAPVEQDGLDRFTLRVCHGGHLARCRRQNSPGFRARIS